jgi:hypothetical protein
MPESVLPPETLRLGADHILLPLPLLVVVLSAVPEAERRLPAVFYSAAALLSPASPIRQRPYEPSQFFHILIVPSSEPVA